jgi:hypothetical protein
MVARGSRFSQVQNAMDALHSNSTGAAAASAGCRRSQSAIAIATLIHGAASTYISTIALFVPPASASAAVSHSSSLRLVTNTRSTDRTIASIESSASCSRKINSNAAIAWPFKNAGAVSRNHPPRAESESGTRSSAKNKLQ